MNRDLMNWKNMEYLKNNWKNISANIDQLQNELFTGNITVLQILENS